MRTRTFGLALVLLAGVPGGGLFAQFAQRHCGLEDFSGNYGILGTGAITVPAPPLTGPFARAGGVVADGKGNSVVNSTGSYNGNLFGEPIPSTYTVSADCNIVFTVPAFAPINLPATFSGLLSDDKQEVVFMIVDPPGQTIRAVVTKQKGGNGRGCTERELSQPYSLFLTGNVITAATGQLPGEFVRVGKFTPDGNGNFSAATNANYNGQVIQAENFSGTYSVATDCSVKIQYSYNGVSFTWSGALINESRGAYVVVSSPAGSAIAGTLQRQ